MIAGEFAGPRHRVTDQIQVRVDKPVNYSLNADLLRHWRANKSLLLPPH